MGVKTDERTDFHALLSPLLGPVTAPTHPHQMQPFSVSYAGFALPSGTRQSARGAYSHTHTHTLLLLIYSYKEKEQQESCQQAIRMALISSQCR